MYLLNIFAYFDLGFQVFTFLRLLRMCVHVLMLLCYYAYVLMLTCDYAEMKRTNAGLHYM